MTPSCHSSRLFANTVRYHHWHQCLEILYVEEGFGVAIVDNRHYTMRPRAAVFLFRRFTLHKVRVDEQAKRFTDVPLFISTLTRCSQPCAIFPTRSSGCRNFLPAAGAWVADLAHCHHHVDHLLGCYPSPLTREE